MTEAGWRFPKRARALAGLGPAMAALAMPAFALANGGAGLSFASLAGFILLLCAALLALWTPLSGKRTGPPLLRAIPLVLLTAWFVWLLAGLAWALIPGAHAVQTLVWCAATLGFAALARAAEDMPWGALALTAAIGAAAWATAQGGGSPDGDKMARGEDGRIALIALAAHPMRGLGLGCAADVTTATLAGRRTAAGWRGALAETGLTGAAFLIAFVLLVWTRATLSRHPAALLATAAATLFAIDSALASETLASWRVVSFLAFAGAAWGASFASPAPATESAPGGAARAVPIPLRASLSAALVLLLVVTPFSLEAGRRMAASQPLSPADDAARARTARALRLNPWQAQAALQRANGLARQAAAEGYPEAMVARAEQAYRGAIGRNPLREDAYIAWADLQRNLGLIHEMRDIVLEGRSACPASPRLALWDAWSALLLRDERALESAWRDAAALAGANRREALRNALDLALAHFLERLGTPRKALDTYTEYLLRNPYDGDARNGLERVAAQLYERPAGKRPQ